MRLRNCLVTFALVLVGGAFAFTLQDSAVVQSPDWTQWGGPHRNFKTDSTGLAESWPEEGPPALWSRPLGDGYSTILAQDGTLYTMYRDSSGEREGQEVVIALSAATGQTRWEYRYDQPLPAKLNAGFGPGPHSTPLLVGDRIFAVGSIAKMHALDKKTGQLLWARDLYNEFSLDRIGLPSNRGYAPSPIAYGDTVILPLGGSGKAVVALRQTDGSVAWRRHDFEIAPSSPILIDVDGQEQLVLFMAAQIIGLNPANGDLYWSHPHETNYDCNISTPVWGEDNLLYLSSAYDSGSRVLHLTQAGGKTSVQELWFNRGMRIHFGSTIRLGDVLYGSSGDFGPAFFMGVEMKTGRILWRQRGLAKAQIAFADDKFVMVDEDGHLVLARPGEKGLDILSKVELLEARSWTAPTLVATRLYLRDRKSIMALDLAPQNSQPGT